MTSTLIHRIPAIALSLALAACASNGPRASDDAAATTIA
ncbi:MAG: hypothetical protein RL354_2462, partial [Planctomycetota bacterium]